MTNIYNYVVITHLEKEKTKDMTPDEINELLVQYFHRNFTNCIDARNALGKKIEIIKKHRNKNTELIQKVIEDINKFESNPTTQNKKDLETAKKSLTKIKETIKIQEKEITDLTKIWIANNTNIIPFIRSTNNADIHHKYTKDIIDKANILYTKNKEIKKEHYKSRTSASTIFKNIKMRECSNDKDCDKLNLLLKKNKYKCNIKTKQCEKENKSKSLTYSKIKKSLLYNIEESPNQVKTSFTIEDLPVKKGGKKRRSNK